MICWRDMDPIFTEKEQVLKMDLRTGSISSLEFSNLGLLGLPSWWSLPANLQFSSRWVCKAKDIIWINWFPSLDFQKGYLFLQTKFHFSKLAACQGTKNCCTEVHIDLHESDKCVCHVTLSSPSSTGQSHQVFFQNDVQELCECFKVQPGKTVWFVGLWAWGDINFVCFVILGLLKDVLSQNWKWKDSVIRSCSSGIFTQAFGWDPQGGVW